MTLDELLKEMEETYNSRALSDGYLRENGYQTAEEYGIGEYGYGIVTVPVKFVLPYLKVVQKIYSPVSIDFCEICCAKGKCNGRCCYEQIKEWFEQAEEETEDENR